MKLIYDFLVKKYRRLEQFYQVNQAALLLVVIFFILSSLAEQILKIWIGFSLSLTFRLSLILIFSFMALRFSLPRLLFVSFGAIFFSVVSLAGGSSKLAEATAVAAFVFMVLGVLGLFLNEMRQGNTPMDEK